MKTITIIPLLALLAVTGCGNHAMDNQSSTNNIAASPAPPSAGDTNIPTLPKTTENPVLAAPPETPSPAVSTETPTPSKPPEIPIPSTTPEKTTPGNGAVTNAPADTNSPGATNLPSGR